MLIIVFQTEPVVPREAHSSCIGARLDPKMCPSNPNLLAYIHDKDIWVSNLETGHEHRLTFAHKGCQFYLVVMVSFFAVCGYINFIAVVLYHGAVSM